MGLGRFSPGLKQGFRSLSRRLTVPLPTESLLSMAHPRPLLSSPGVSVTSGGLEFSCSGACFCFPVFHLLSLSSSSPESC